VSIDDKKMVQTLYDYVYDALTVGPSIAGGPNIRASGRDRTYLTMQLPGTPVDASQFANEWTPSNPDGTTVATENFARFIDVLPNLSPLHSASGQSLESLYGNEVVRANVIPPPVDPAKQEAFSKAMALLFVDGTDFDDEGKPITVKVESPLLRNYKNKMSAYDAAVTSYMTAFLSYDLSKPADQRAWAILSPRLQTPVTQAWNDLQAAQPGRVETALATVGQDQASSLAKRFADARALFDQTKLGSLLQPGTSYHWAQAFPANWFASSAAQNFAQVTLSSDKYYSSSSSSFSSWGGSAGVNFGLFSIGGGAGGSSSRRNVSTDTSSIRMAFRMARVELRRPWLDPSLLSLGGWSVQGRQRGAYSNGKSDASNRGMFPLFPTAFVVARDIQISATWGHTDLETISKNVHGGGGFSIGPFRVSGGGGSSSSSIRVNSAFDGKTITIPGLQVIAWVNQAVPLSPPINGG
jgi:hypothetical protein